MNRHQARQEITRDRLLAAARAAFQSRGFDAVTMRDVAKAAGFSTGAIFCNFGSKAGLYEAAFGRKAPDVAGFLDDVLRLKDPDALDLMTLRCRAETLRAQMFGARA